jgi:7,8-dihydropterin-6-yl-methyl-4-(beta-D-ribofuranosyl)aminobenzene 5'-phosphate synthase
MIGISVLMENTRVARDYECKHGLSMAIHNGAENILLDVGPDGGFLSNAAKLKVDIENMGALVLSHSHSDHTGGLDAFCGKNDHAPIYLFDRTESKYYVRVWGSIKVPVGLKCSASTKKRIARLTDNKQIASNTWFIKNTVHAFKKPLFNESLYKKTDAGMERDDFAHEGILVMENDGGLVVFNSCSHNGVINSIESVKKEFAGKPIRSYVGGFHFYNPMARRHEDDGYLDEFADYIRRENIHLYTGHCTGDYCIEYLKGKIGNLVDALQTGKKASV